MQEKSIVKKNILQVIEKEGINAAEFYRKTGITRGILTQNNGMSEENTTRFLDFYPDVSAEWLLTGKGNMYKAADNFSMVQEPGLQYGIEKSLPLIPIDAMAGFANNPATIFEVDCERYVVPAFKGADFLIPVRGNSMQPRYNSGDIVACKKLAKADIFFQWGKAYVLDTEQGAMLKRIQPGKDEEHILVVSDNNELYKPFDLHLSKINAIAIVCGIIRLV